MGETDWHFGSLTLQSLSADPVTFEVGVFFFRAQGFGHSAAHYKTYVDVVDAALGDSAAIIEDATNGTPPTGVDGRVGVFNDSAQVQAVFTNRNAAIGGTGFRIASTADTADTSAAGGVAAKQRGPIGFGFETGDGLLGYRFNITLASTATLRTIMVHTPGYDTTARNRINGYSSYLDDGSNTSGEFKATTTSDPITLHASWVPGPASSAALGLSVVFITCKRRSASS